MILGMLWSCHAPVLISLHTIVCLSVLMPLWLHSSACHSHRVQSDAYSDMPAPMRPHSPDPLMWCGWVRWLGMRPSFTSYWAHTKKPQIITFYGVRGISPDVVCSTQRSPLAVFSLSVSVHYTTLLSNTIHAILLQKRALRVITRDTYYAHTEARFLELGILKFTTINIYLIGNFVYIICNNLLPPYFNSFLIKNTRCIWSLY